MSRQLLVLHCATLLLVVTMASATAQRFVAQSNQVQYGVRPVLQVASDGVVHLDGPLASQSRPQSVVVAQPGQAIGISATQPYGVQVGANTSPSVLDMWDQFANNLLNGPVPPEFVHRHGFWGEFLYLRPRDAEVAYALPIDGPVAPVLGNEVPIGPTAVVDPDYEPAFRVGFNLRLNCGASITSQYTYFRSDSASSATINAADGVLRSLVTHPLSMNTATDTLDANAFLDIDYDLVDVDYRGLIVGCESCQGQCAYVVNYLLGGRYVRLDQDFRSNFVVTGTTSVNTNVDFEGGGIRLGLEGERHSTSTGLYVYGLGVTNLMVGEFKADYRQVNTFNGVEAFTNWSAGRIVPVLDLELGLGWVGPRRHLRFSGGYLVSTWFNVVKTDDWIHASQSHDFRDPTGTLTFDGLVARAELRF